MKGAFRSSRFGLIIVITVFLSIVVGEIALLSRKTDHELFYWRNDRTKTAVVDRLLFTDTAEAFRAGEMKHVIVADGSPARITLDQEKQKGYPRDGTWTSPVVEADFPFTELLPSWNLIAPNGTGVAFHVRTRDLATRAWSPWLHIGGWGRINDRHSLRECAAGYIDDDTLKLHRPAQAYQIRARLLSFSFALDQTPAIRRITATYSGPVSEDSVWAKAMHPDAGPAQRWAKDLNVPFRAQGDNEYAVTGMTCSPTSVSMVLHYWGINRPTMENALAIWDNHNEMFGNWSNNVQRCGELGMDAWLERFRNWEQVKELIARGQPVVASIYFEKGSYPDHPYDDSTDGHLIVIRGFMPDGTVIVNDPGSKKYGEHALWPAQGLAHAWFGHGGVGYVIHPPATPLPAALVKSSPQMPTTKAVAESR